MYTAATPILPSKKPSPHGDFAKKFSVLVTFLGRLVVPDDVNNTQEPINGWNQLLMDYENLGTADDLIKEMLRKKNTKTTILNEENFDEIETQLEKNEE